MSISIAAAPALHRRCSVYLENDPLTGQCRGGMHLVGEGATSTLLPLGLHQLPSLSGNLPASHSSASLGLCLSGQHLHLPAATTLVSARAGFLHPIAPGSTPSAVSIFRKCTRVSPLMVTHPHLVSSFPHPLLKRQRETGGEGGCSVHHPGSDPSKGCQRPFGMAGSSTLQKFINGCCLDMSGLPQFDWLIRALSFLCALAHSHLICVTLRSRGDNPNPADHGIPC